MLNERLSKNLKKLRHENNWTQETAAELCDISPRFWGKIERCKANPTLGTLEKIASGLGVSVEELLKDVEALDITEE